MDAGRKPPRVNHARASHHGAINAVLRQKRQSKLLQSSYSMRWALRRIYIYRTTAERPNRAGNRKTKQASRSISARAGLRVRVLAPNRSRPIRHEKTGAEVGQMEVNVP